MDKVIPLFRNKHIRAICISALLIVIASWCRERMAGSLMVDGHVLGGLQLVIVFILYMAGICGYCYSLYQLWSANNMQAGEIKLMAYILAVLFSCMLPMLSNDFYSLLTYGDASNRGVDVYTVTTMLHLSPYYEYVSELWKTAPCVYGPVVLLHAKLAAWTGGTLYGSLLAYKILALIWSVIFIDMLSRLSAKLNASPSSYLFIVLNPVFMIQAVAQLHCDGIAATLVLCMLYAFLTDRWRLAFAFAALAILSKMSYVLMLPFLFTAILLRDEDLLSKAGKILKGMLIVAGILAIFYLPFYTSSETFSRPFTFLLSQSPSKSLTEIAGDIIYFAPQLLRGHEDQLQSTIHRTSATEITQTDVWNKVSLLCKIFALLISGILLYKFGIGDRTLKNWWRTFLRLLMLFLLFYSPVFYAWYPMLFLPFMLLEDDGAFMGWAFGFSFLISLQDTVCFADRSEVIYFIILGLTFLSVAAYVWRFRRVYFRQN